MRIEKLVELCDEELARRARAGSIDSFEELVRRYQVPLLRFLQRRGPNPGDAEDTLQESFMRAYQSLDRYREGRPFKPWLFTLAYRVSISMARKAVLKIEASELETVPSYEEGPVHQTLREDDRRSLWKTARRTLDEEQFTVVWLYYAESMPAPDVARIMGRSWVWVKTTLRRSRLKLLAAMPPAREELPVRSSAIRGES